MSVMAASLMANLSVAFCITRSGYPTTRTEPDQAGMSIVKQTPQAVPDHDPQCNLAKRFGVLSNPSVLNQQTLNRPASFSGIGLHSGNRVNMTILPAPANSGVRFRRVDLEGKPEIEARVENVGETNRSTTLAKGNVKIHTVEHVLAALAGYGIDNAVIELDANEPPIADGS